MADQKYVPMAIAPEPLTIPQATLDRWLALPENGYLEVAFTRNDWDTLFSSLNNGLLSQNRLDQALVEWSNGQTGEANIALNEARRLRGESSNALRRFFMQLMSSATRASSHE